MPLKRTGKNGNTCKFECVKKPTMERILLLVLFIAQFPFANSAQELSDEFDAVYDKFLGINIFEGISEEDKAQIAELEKLMTFLRGYTKNEDSLNGKVDFGFSGNQSDLRNLVRLNAGINIDYGNYPYQLDFSTSVQTLINNGAFQENISNIDVSFDYTHSNIGNGLWLENYVLLKRFGDDYLGIKQRYEVGAGFIFNFRSKQLTHTGQKHDEELSRKPTVKTNGDDLIICYEEICSKVSNPKKLNSEECQTIAETRRAYKNANRKKYNRLRLALLTGIFYEIDQSDAINTLSIGGRDTLVALIFPTQTYWRWEIRPTIDWRPDDRFRLKISPYLKMPLGILNQTTVRDENLVDERMDYFVDFRCSLTASLSKKISIDLNYRYLYDNAPNRAFVDNGTGNKILLLAQQSHQIYSMTFGFDF